MEKINAVFPNTFRLLGPDRATVVREFVGAFPPADIARIENARQFYDFLCAHWRNAPLQPPYLRDVAACEFALARVRSGIIGAHTEAESGKPPRLGAIRRQPDIVLLRCAYSIRPIFEDDADEAVPVKRDTPLAIAIPPGGEHPRILEMPPPVFDALGALNEWTDRSELGAAFELDEFIGELAHHGLIEVRM
jgi:hypothetical protein